MWGAAGPVTASAYLPAQHHYPPQQAGQAYAPQYQQYQQQPQYQQYQQYPQYQQQQQYPQYQQYQQPQYQQPQYQHPYQQQPQQQQYQQPQYAQGVAPQQGFAPYYPQQASLFSAPPPLPSGAGTGWMGGAPPAQPPPK